MIHNAGLGVRAMRINIGTNQQTTLRQVAHPSSLSILMLVLFLF